MSHSDDAPDAGKVAAAGEAWKLPKLALVRARESALETQRTQWRCTRAGTKRIGAKRTGRSCIWQHQPQTTSC